MIKNFIIALMLCFVSTNSFADEKCPPLTTKEELLEAQKKWGDGIVSIGKVSNFKEAALQHIENLYAYDMGDVLFKPTKAEKKQFRKTKEQALSYFVGGINPEDKGFALAPYTEVRFENDGFIIDCDSSLAMGNYYFKDKQGNETKVEYSFGYIKDEKGKLRINLHHSSIPYVAH